MHISRCYYRFELFFVSTADLALNFSILDPFSLRLGLALWVRVTLGLGLGLVLGSVRVRVTLGLGLGLGLVVFPPSRRGVNLYHDASIFLTGEMGDLRLDEIRHIASD